MDPRAILCLSWSAPELFGSRSLTMRRCSLPEMLHSFDGCACMTHLLIDSVPNGCLAVDLNSLPDPWSHHMTRDGPPGSCARNMNEHTLPPLIKPSSLALIRFRTMTTLPVLPYDIWIHVASFITSDDLKRLMLVHRAFFHLVMYSVYREVLIYHEGEYSTNRCLNVMG